MLTGGWAGCCDGGVTITAGGIAGFSATGGWAGGADFSAGGETTTVFSAGGVTVATGAWGLMTLGCSWTGAGVMAGAGGCGLGAITAGEAATGTGRCGTGGWCCCCSFSWISLNTSPGLEILERSILGLTSPGVLRSLAVAEPDLTVKCLLIFSASSGSIELEWVFFSVMPNSSKTSRIALLFTSSSLARSLIRIFIRSAFPPNTRYTIIMTSRLKLYALIRALILKKNRFQLTVLQPVPAWPALQVEAFQALPSLREQAARPRHEYGLQLHRPVEHSLLRR